MNKHTVGPWFYFQDISGRDYIITDNPEATVEAIGYGTVYIGTVRSISSGNDHEANACLIAAAPELLAIAEHIIAIADDAYLRLHPVWLRIVDEARAAIAKATS